ncbi:hypothetical protein CWC03_10775 [Pseudoalteromonas sp. S2755]|nr:hypothetical protein CWC03_10775 [Pseudoalteromonas sp. S2755]
MELTAEKFLKDVKQHRVTVIKDDGMYRHLLVREPGTVCQSFNIVTSPGILFYYGDMGSFTFSRVQDMFEFFRDSKLRINAHYWSEKLVSVDRHGGYKAFSFDKFKTNVLDYCETEAQKEWIRSELNSIEEDEFGAVEFYRSFKSDNEYGIDLSDFWECDNNEYTPRYLWCCYAVVWTIQQYDLLLIQNKSA